MRILHASDWHLGKTLEGRSRVPEQADYLDEVVRLAEDVDLVLIAGDVFDVYNPPIDAEELYFDVLARLGRAGRREVVVIAGNHDSPDRIAASRPLARSHGVHIAGRTTGAGPLHLSLPAGDVVIGALPYPSEARLNTMLDAEAREERSLQAAYSARVGAVLHELARAFRPGAVNLLTSHLQVRACLQSESERALIGGAYQVETDVFPATAQYVALGHLHRPQAVPDVPIPVRYCGAPLAYRFSERDAVRTHTLVELEPGGTARVEEIPIDAGRPLVVWEAASVPEVVAGAAAGLHADAFVELHVRSERSLGHAELSTLRKLPRDFVRIRVDLPDAGDVLPPEVRHTLGAAELFRAFHRDQLGSEPESALVDLFVELSDPHAGAD